MNPAKTVSDVFLSFPASETAWAAAVERRLIDAGLTVFVARDVPGGNSTDADRTWEAMAESAAVVSLARGPRETSPSFLFEVGAAMAWHKPVFVVYEGERPSDMPKYVQGGIYPAERFDDVIELISRAGPTLTERERSALVKAYVAVGVTIDQLLLEPAKSDQLVREYRRLTKARTSGERLFRELLRMRKRGQLVTTPRTKTRTKSTSLRRPATQRATA
jgi:hypothetical protein